MTRREGLLFGGALLFGAALAFPAGLWVARSQATVRPTAQQPQADRRAVFSPDVRGDPYVLDHLRQQVEALEAHCRRTGEMCPEARGARLRLEELQSR